MTLRTDLSGLLLIDNTTAVTAAPTNTLALTIADKYDAHVAGSADTHATTAIADGAFTGIVAITDTATTDANRLRQVISGLIAMSGVSTTSFATAMSTLPATLTSVNAVLTAATAANTVSTLVKRDGSGNFAAAQITATAFVGGTFTGTTGTFSGLLIAGTGPTTLTDAAGKILAAALNTVGIPQGGTGATTQSGARAALAVAQSGVNADITQLTGLTTPLSPAQGGTGAATLTGVVIGAGTGAFTAKANPAGAFVGDTDTQTLTNKTFTAPTITNPTMSGTIAVGTSTYSGTPTFSGVVTFGVAPILPLSGIVKGNGASALTAVAAPSGVLVGDTDTQTLLNKTLGNTNTLTLKTSGLTIQDATDATKQLRLDLSGISAAATRTLVVPDASDTFALLTLAQTLTNKTFTAPTINGATLTGTIGTGTSIFSGTPTFSGNVAMSGTLGVTGLTSLVNATLSGTLNVTGASTLAAVTLTGALSGVGATLTGTLTGVAASFTGALSAAGITGTGLLTMGSGANVLTNAAGLLDASKHFGTLPFANGGTGLSSTSGYAILAANAAGTALAPIAAGTNGQLLTMVAGAPAFATLTSVVPDYSLGVSKFADGAVTAQAVPDKTINVASVHTFDQNGQPVVFPGVSSYDLTALIPTNPTQNVSVLVYLNGTALLRTVSGQQTSGTPTKPPIPPNSTPLAYVALSTGQTTVTQANITDWRTDFAPYISLPNGVFSAIGHIHGQGNEATVPINGIDEGKVVPIAPTASMSVYIQPMRWTDATNATQQYAGGTVGPISTPTTGVVYVPVSLSSSGTPVVPAVSGLTSYATVAQADAARPPFPANNIPLAYVVVRSSSTAINATDQGNAYLIEARRPLTYTSVGTGGTQTVPTGGTGQTSFTAGILVSPGGTGALTTIPATINSGTVYLGFAPTLVINPAGTNSDLASFGGTFNTGGTGGTRLSNIHILAPTISGGGTWATLYSLLVDAPAGGTSNIAIGTPGAVSFTGGGTLGGTFAGATTFSGAITLSAAATALAVTNNATVGGTLGVTGVATFTTSVIAPTIGTASGTGQLTIPAATSDTIATLALAQTFTNKTLTAPAISNPAITGGGSLAGTFSGAHAYSGALTLSAAGTALTVTNNATIGGTTTLGALAGILFGTAGVVSAVSATGVLIGAGTGVPTAIAEVDNSFLVGNSGAWAARTPAQSRAHMSVNYQEYGFFFGGKPAASGTGSVQRQGVSRAVSLATSPANGSHVAKLGTATTASKTFNITKNGTNIGTVVFASGTTGTVTITSTPTTFAAGDDLGLTAPGVQDTTLADAIINLVTDY